MIDNRYFETVEELKEAVKNGKIIEYDYSNGFKNHYVVIDFTLPLLTDEIDTYSNDFNSEQYNCIGYDSPLKNYRIKSDEDIQRDKEKEHNRKIEETIAKLISLKAIFDDIENNSMVVSRFFNNRSFEFQNEIIDSEIVRLNKEKYII